MFRSSPLIIVKIALFAAIGFFSCQFLVSQKSVPPSLANNNADDADAVNGAVNTASRQMNTSATKEYVRAAIMRSSDRESTKHITVKLSIQPKDIQGVEKFVFFIGYPRSGHSIIGSMMDAHPNMIIAHEFRLFTKWAENPAQYMNKSQFFDALYKHSFRDANKGWRTAKKNVKGYTLQLNTTRQGRFDELKVIGDKSGGRTTATYNRSPTAFFSLYRQLAETVQVPVHVIHVVRNPYDMIATHTLYMARMYGQATSMNKFDNQTLLKLAEELYFNLAAGVQAMKKNLPLKLLEVRIEEFIRDPKNIIRGICSYLDLECPTEYVQECYDKAFKTVSRSRDLVVWDPATLALVNEKMKKYPFFQGYSFQEDFPK